jgi:hypothetical protein
MAWCATAISEALTDRQHNDIVVSMIPSPDPQTGYLPRGVHKPMWGEISAQFATNSHRGVLLDGLLRAVTNLAGAGCRVVLLDGSFVSEKQFPQDYDGTWEPYGVDPDLVDPVLLDFSHGRAAMKAKYAGELFPASWEAAAGVLYRDYFQERPQRRRQRRASD